MAYTLKEYSYFRIELKEEQDSFMFKNQTKLIEIESKIGKALSINPYSFKLNYKDDDGEINQINNDDDLEDAIEYFADDSVLPGSSNGGKNEIILELSISIQNGISLSESSHSEFDIEEQVTPKNKGKSTEVDRREEDENYSPYSPSRSNLLPRKISDSTDTTNSTLNPSKEPPPSIQNRSVRFSDDISTIISSFTSSSSSESSDSDSDESIPDMIRSQYLTNCRLITSVPPTYSSGSSNRDDLSYFSSEFEENFPSSQKNHTSSRIPTFSEHVANSHQQSYNVSKFIATLNINPTKSNNYSDSRSIITSTSTTTIPNFNLFCSNCGENKFQELKYVCSCCGPISPLRNQSEITVTQDDEEEEERNGFELCSDCVQTIGVNHANEMSSLASKKLKNITVRGGGEEVVLELRHSFLEVMATPTTNIHGWREVDYEDSPTCTICDKSVIRDRFKCLSCPQFELCLNCYKSVEEIHPSHCFLSIPDLPRRLTADSTIPIPSTKSIISRNTSNDRVTPEDIRLAFLRARGVDLPTNNLISDVRHIGVVCFGCSVEIIGVRYSCSVCDEFDLCSSCETIEPPLTIDYHEINHIVLKIKVPVSTQVINSAISKARDIEGRESTSAERINYQPTRSTNLSRTLSSTRPLSQSPSLEEQLQYPSLQSHTLRRSNSNPAIRSPSTNILIPPRPRTSSLPRSLPRPISQPILTSNSNLHQYPPDRNQNLRRANSNPIVSRGNTVDQSHSSPLSNSTPRAITLNTSTTDHSYPPHPHRSTSDPLPTTSPRASFSIVYDPNNRSGLNFGFTWGNNSVPNPSISTVSTLSTPTPPLPSTPSTASSFPLPGSYPQTEEAEVEVGDVCSCDACCDILEDNSERWLCAQCEVRIFLCSNCEKSSHLLHDPLHCFLRIVRPLVNFNQSQSLPILYDLDSINDDGNYSEDLEGNNFILHNNVFCDVCLDVIQGYWMRCATCESSYDICYDCLEDSTHPEEHILIKFKKKVDFQLLRDLTGFSTSNPRSLMSFPLYKNP